MNNEETILDSQYTTESNTSEKPQAEPQKAKAKGSNYGEKAAYAAGGAVFGAGATMAGQTMAATVPEASEEPEVVKTEESTAEMPKPEDSPSPEDSIVATAEGVRVAQVDDDASFAEAFADARAQVGPGGVFEWHGRVYGTYYKDEWDEMTPQERQEYQASIEYEDVMSSESQAAHHNNMAHHAVNHNSGISYEEQPQEVQTASVDDGEVHVISVGESDLNQDGVPENAAVLEVNGHQILVVDIDHDGMADLAMADVNGDGSIAMNEVADVQSENIGMPDIDPGNEYLAQASNEPDYMNDADVGVYEA